MNQDAWADRFAAVVAAKLTKEDVQTLLDLIEEDGERILEALEAFVAQAEESRDE